MIYLHFSLTYIQILIRPRRALPFQTLPLFLVCAARATTLSQTIYIYNWHIALHHNLASRICGSTNSYWVPEERRKAFRENFARGSKLLTSKTRDDNYCLRYVVGQYYQQNEVSYDCLFSVLELATPLSIS